MLIQFRFKNFKSFKDDTILDLSATKITEHSDRVVQAGNEKVLSTAAIFGANASGKSNVIEAFRFMATYVIESFAFGGEGDEKKSKTKKLKHTPFLFDKESRDSESSFEVYFITSEETGCKSYNYGFTLEQNGVVEEWLNTKSKTARTYKSVFYRNRDELDLSGLPAKSQEIIRLTLERETLIVSLGAKLKISKLKCIRDWFYNTNFANFGNPLENAFLSSLIPDGFADSKDVQQKVVDYFATFDSSIVGFNVEVIKGDDEDSRHVRIDAMHKVIGSDELASIPLEEESDGTLKMFALYPALQDTLESGGLLFVDELNARLHFLYVDSSLLSLILQQILNTLSWFLRHMILGSFQTIYSVEMKSGSQRKHKPVCLPSIPLQISLMLMA